MSCWLARFACETHNTNGKVPSVYHLLRLLHLACAIDPDCPNFLDTKNPQFKEMHAIIDNYFCELHAEGVGAEDKHTSIISKEEEDRLWEERILGVDTPEALLHAVFYLNGRNFCPRRDKEHCALNVSNCSA